MVIAGYISALLIGVVLGLFGAGGAIISFPALVYFMNIPPQQASNYSLIIVGIASVAGVFQHIRNKNINLKITIIFSIPLLIAFYITKFFILPSIPEIIIQTSGYVFTKNHLIMFIFFITLTFIILHLITKKSSFKEFSTNPISSKITSIFQLFNYIIYSLLVGVLAASVGAGGGFIIVPALMKLYHLSIKQATATSLLIISTNAIVGTFLNSQFFSDEHLSVIILFSLLAITGIVIGTYINKIISSAYLLKYYTYFLISILISTIFSEIYSFSFKS